jgi:hypothetical protein
VEWAPVLDKVPRASLGSYVMLCYLSLASLLSFLRLLYLSGREVSKVRMRGVTVLEVDWASEEAPDLAETPLNQVLLQDMQEVLILKKRRRVLLASLQSSICQKRIAGLKN